MYTHNYVTFADFHCLMFVFLNEVISILNQYVTKLDGRACVRHKHMRRFTSGFGQVYSGDLGMQSISEGLAMRKIWAGLGCSNLYQTLLKGTSTSISMQFLFWRIGLAYIHMLLGVEEPNDSLILPFGFDTLGLFAQDH
jgi:hypothetical protein